jgi:hypothetical protein
MMVYWHARFHKDPANQWLRTFFFKTFSESQTDQAKALAIAS